MSPATSIEPERLVGGDQTSEPFANTSARVVWNRSYADACALKRSIG
jgi:hypothetical protein